MYMRTADVVSVATSVPLRRNSTFDTVPSASDALAVTVRFSGATSTALLAGAVIAVDRCAVHDRRDRRRGRHRALVVGRPGRQRVRAAGDVRPRVRVRCRGVGGEPRGAVEELDLGDRAVGVARAGRKADGGRRREDGVGGRRGQRHRWRHVGLDRDVDSRRGGRPARVVVGLRREHVVAGRDVGPGVAVRGGGVRGQQRAVAQEFDLGERRARDRCRRVDRDRRRRDEHRVVRGTADAHDRSRLRRDAPGLRLVARVDRHLVVVDAAAIAERIGERHGQRVSPGVDHAVELGLDEPAVVAPDHHTLSNVSRQLQFGAHRCHERIRPGAPDGATTGTQFHGHANPGERRPDLRQVSGHRDGVLRHPMRPNVGACVEDDDRHGNGRHRLGRSALHESQYADRLPDSRGRDFRRLCGALAEEHGAPGSPGELMDHPARRVDGHRQRIARQRPAQPGVSEVFGDVDRDHLARRRDHPHPRARRVGQHAGHRAAECHGRELDRIDLSAIALEAHQPGIGGHPDRVRPRCRESTQLDIEPDRTVEQKVLVVAEEIATGQHPEPS